MCLAKHFQEVMVFREDYRDIHSLANLLRKTTVGIAKWAPTQDGACGPVNHRTVLLETGKFQNNRNMWRCNEEELYCLTVVTRNPYLNGHSSMGDFPYRAAIQCPSIHGNRERLSGKASKLSWHP
jgi:hypothetical protein